MSTRLPEASIYCLGDIVGYGANPNEVVDWVRKRCTLAILGNHDYAVITGDTSWFNHEAEEAIIWTQKVLSRESREYLQQLLNTSVIQIDGSRLMMVHGSPIDPLNEYVDPSTHERMFEYYLKRFGADIITMGHTHIPYAWRSPQGIVFNPGSIGQPRSGKSKASYAVLESDDRSIEVKHEYVEYDIGLAAQKILDAGLPSFLAARLYKGI